MNTGWLKSFRKAQDHPIWQDKNAWRVFQWLLWNVDYETGKGTFGRKQIALGTGLTESTVYRANSRLTTKYNAIVMKSNNKFSEISVLNWARYQSVPDERTPKRTTNEQQKVMKSNTIKEERRKDLKNNVLTNDDKSSEELSVLKKQLGVPETPVSGITHEFQAQTMQIIQALGVSDNRKSAYFAAVKNSPRSWILDAYAFAEDHPTSSARDKMFFWKLNELKRGHNAETN